MTLLICVIILDNVYKFVLWGLIGMGYKIYCDMDGVLTNFMKQVNKYGSSYLELLNTPDISWSKNKFGWYWFLGKYGVDE